MVTLHRRRQYRDRRAWYASEAFQNLKLALYLAVAMGSLGLLMLTVALGDPFVTAVFGR